jgi:hypothetical protein
VTLSEFRVRFPEFSRLADPLVEDCLAEATRQTPEKVWGEKQVDGIKWLAAHLAALSPSSRDLKMVGKDGDSMYLTRRRQLESVVASGWRISGGIS